jgi:hypothetical protein
MVVFVRKDFTPRRSAVRFRQPDSEITLHRGIDDSIRHERTFDELSPATYISKTLCHLIHRTHVSVPQYLVFDCLFGLRRTRRARNTRSMHIWIYPPRTGEHGLPYWLLQIGFFWDARLSLHPLLLWTFASFRFYAYMGFEILVFGIGSFEALVFVRLCHTGIRSVG